MSTMQQFLDDYERELRESCYAAEFQPFLSLADKQFQLAFAFSLSIFIQ